MQRSTCRSNWSSPPPITIQQGNDACARFCAREQKLLWPWLNEAHLTMLLVTLLPPSSISEFLQYCGQLFCVSLGHQLQRRLEIDYHFHWRQWPVSILLKQGMYPNAGIPAVLVQKQWSLFWFCISSIWNKYPWSVIWLLLRPLNVELVELKPFIPTFLQCNASFQVCLKLLLCCWSIVGTGKMGPKMGLKWP